MLKSRELQVASSPQPYLQIAAVLRDRILSGQYRAGEWLPSERLLTEDLQIHRRVVRAAIDQLVRAGLLLRSPNCRPVIAAVADRSQDGPEGPTSLPEILQAPATTVVPSAQGASGLFAQLGPSRFVALVMWSGGGPLEREGSSQQRIFWGLNQALAQAGYQGIFLNLGESIGSPQENAAREEQHLRFVLNQNLGGAIFYPYAYEANRDLIAEASRRIPFCLIDRMLPGVEADYVGVQNFEGMRDATQHLIEQGHRRIAYVTKSEAINPVQDRLRGYIHALNYALGTESDEIILTAPSFRSVPWSLFDRVFNQPHDLRPTAVLAFNDYEAVKVAERLGRLGLEVPRDVVLTGFDDIVPMLPNGVGLTSVAQPFEEIGREAAAAFLRRVADPRIDSQRIELPTRLIIRDSSRSSLTSR